jgi:succinoglycan biosynthesis protein ExoV
VKLEYFKGHQPNFGDELNTWLWPKLLPDFFDNDPRVLFLGIGSIIGSHYDGDAKKVVFGAGYVPAYQPQIPNVHGGDWDIFFVRGPKTARALGLPESLGIGDAAILLPTLNVQFRREPRHIGFMPHWESLPHGNWQTTCDLAGIRLIDPRAPVEQVITEILGCKILITEAMHGAIVADALRVPWVPVLPIQTAHREKWFDWAEALSLELSPHRLWPSSHSEVQTATVRRPFVSGIAAGMTWWPISSLTETFIVHAAARRLSALAKRSPCMSADGVIETTIDKMRGKLYQLEKHYRK